MSLVLIQEVGAGRADANSYASISDGESYHAAHLYASAWTTAGVDRQTMALVMATRLIDSECEFLGFRKTTTQALQWPRVQVPDCEASGVYWVPGMLAGVGPMAPVYLAENVVPPCVIAATCELARELLKKDRTSEPVGQGLKSTLTSGVALVFDKTDRPGFLTAAVWSLLRRVLAGGHGNCVRLVRR